MSKGKNAVARSDAEGEKQKPASKEVASRKPRAANKLQQQFFSRRQIADLLGVSPKFIVSLVKRGKLREHSITPFLKRYRLSDVEACLAAHQLHAKAAA
jgi:hypothetical protein